MARVNAQTRSPSLLSYTFTSPSSDPNLHCSQLPRRPVVSTGSCARHCRLSRDTPALPTPTARAPAHGRRLPPVAHDLAGRLQHRARSCTAASARAAGSGRSGRRSTSPWARLPAWLWRCRLRRSCCCRGRARACGGMLSAAHLDVVRSCATCVSTCKIFGRIMSFRAQG